MSLKKFFSKQPGAAAASQRLLYCLFLLPGLALSSWVTRTPALRDGLQASTQEMGGILFGFSCGAMGGVLSAAWLTHKFGARRTIATGLAAVALGMTALAFSLGLQSAWLAFAALLVFGIGMGWADIALNIEAAAVERKVGKPLMSKLHGFFSLGTLVGALLGSLATSLQVSMLVHLTAMALACLLITLACTYVMKTGVMKTKVPANGHEPQKQGVTQRSGILHELSSPQMLLICLIVLAMALAEGTANDWLPLLMIDGHGYDATTGNHIYVAFTLAMTAGRFAGGVFVTRVGTIAALCTSALLGALGLAIIIFSPHAGLAAGAVLLWGLGASLGFPLALSAAANAGGNSALRVSIAATAGYVGFLVGPPTLGFLGEHHGLKLAMLPVLLAIVLAFLAAVLLGRSATGLRAVGATH